MYPPIGPDPLSYPSDPLGAADCVPCGDGGMQLTDQERDKLNAAEADLSAAELEVAQLVGELLGPIDQELLAVRGGLELMLAELSGQVVLAIDEAIAPVDRLVTRLVGEVDRPLSQMSDELWSVGIVVPYTWGQQLDALQGDPIDLLLTALPTLGPMLSGYNTAGAGDASYAAPSVLPFPGAAPAVGVVEYVPVPPVPPVTVTGTGTSGGDSEADEEAGGCCETSVTVNVTVPPIAVNLPKLSAPGRNGEEPTFPISAPGLVAPARPGEPGTAEPVELVAPTVPTRPQIPGIDDLLPGGKYGPSPQPAPIIPGVIPPRPPAPPVPPRPSTPQPVPAVIPSQFQTPPGAAPPAGAALITPTALSSLGTLDPAVPDFNDPAVCSFMPNMAAKAAASGLVAAPTQRVEGGTNFNNYVLVGGMSAGDMVEKVFGKKTRDGVSNVFDLGGFLLDKSAENALNIVTGGVAFDLLGLSRMPNTLTIQFHAVKLAMAELAEQKTNLPFTYLASPDRYALQYWAPQYLPSQAAVDAAYLTDHIDAGLWDCWTRALGNLPEPHRRALLSQQTRPGPHDIVQLWFRGLLRDEDLFARMRQQGVLDPSYTREWVELAKQLPTQSDLLRFMVRDAADPKVVEAYRLDEGFQQKFGDRIRKWSTALGLEPEVFLYFWRSHWQIPSNTQLYEMLARLRPDRPEVIAWDQNTADIPPEERVALFGPRPPVVTAEDVKQALQVNDLMPGWVDPSMLVSYQPITRTDAIRAFEIGAFDEEQLYHAYRNNRYSPTDARTLVEYTKQLKNRRQANATNVWNIRKVVRYYKNAAINRADAEQYLAPLQPDRESVRRILDAADQELQADLMHTRIKGTRREFMYGELSVEAVGTRLAGFGMGEEAASRLAAGWKIDRDTRYRQPTVKMLKEWWEAQAISADEWFRRLVNLGYTERDAKLIIMAGAGVEADPSTFTPNALIRGIAKAVKSQVEARKLSVSTLEERHKQLVSELGRIRRELNRRREGAGSGLLAPLELP